MKAKHILLLFVAALLVVGTGLTLSAQETKAKAVKAVDPIIGKWKLNIAKSKASLAETLKERTEVYREIDVDLMEYTGTETNADGSSMSGTYTWSR